MRVKYVKLQMALMSTFLFVSAHLLPPEWNIFAYQIHPPKLEIAPQLTGFVQKQREIYHDYLFVTGKTYKYLERLLGIDTANEEIPDEYVSLADITVQTKRKIMIDLALEKLRRKEDSLLIDSEREALRIDQSTLKPLRQICMDRLEALRQAFTTTIRATLKSKRPLSISNDGDNLEVLFLLDKESINPC